MYFKCFPQGFHRKYPIRFPEHRQEEDSCYSELKALNSGFFINIFFQETILLSESQEICKFSKNKERGIKMSLQMMDV